MSYTYADNTVTIEQLIQRSRDMGAKAALRLLDDRCTRQHELLRRVLNFLTSPKWGTIAYMDAAVYGDADTLVELIRKETETAK